MLDAGDVGAQVRRGAGRDQDALRPDHRAGRDQLDRMRVHDHGAALDDLDLGPLQVRRVGGFEPHDLAILVGDQRRPVEDGRLDGPAVARRVLEIAGKARRIDQELLRDAAADHARAANPKFLGDHHPRAIARRDARSAHPARARADDEQVDVVISHARSFAGTWRL